MRCVPVCLVGLIALGPWPAQAQAQEDRPSVGLMPIEDLAQTGQTEVFSAMIENAIVGTARFRVIERERLNQLLAPASPARGGSSRTRSRTTAPAARVDYLIHGTITSVSARARSSIGTSLIGGALSGLLGGGGNVRCHNQEATMSVDVRITNPETGEIRHAMRINETQRAAMVCSEQIEIDEARLMRAAAEGIATALVTTIYPIQIAAVQGDGTLVLNYGEGTVRSGAILGVYAVGQPIRDPTTNHVIGNEETRLGYVRVGEVSTRMSRAAPIGSFVPQIGATLRPASEEDIRALNRSQRNRRSRR